MIEQAAETCTAKFDAKMVFPLESCARTLNAAAPPGRILEAVSVMAMDLTPCVDIVVVVDELVVVVVVVVEVVVVVVEFGKTVNEMLFVPVPKVLWALADTVTDVPAAGNVPVMLQVHVVEGAGGAFDGVQFEVGVSKPPPLILIESIAEAPSTLCAVDLKLTAAPSTLATAPCSVGCVTKG